MRRDGLPKEMLGEIYRYVKRSESRALMDLCVLTPAPAPSEKRRALAAKFTAMSREENRKWQFQLGEIILPSSFVIASRVPVPLSSYSQRLGKVFCC